MYRIMYKVIAFFRDSQSFLVSLRDGICSGDEWPAGEVSGRDGLRGGLLPDVHPLHEGQENRLHGGLHDEQSQ